MSYSLDLEELKDELESLLSDIETYVEENFPKTFEKGFDPEDVKQLRSVMKRKKFDSSMEDDCERAIAILELKRELGDLVFDSCTSMVNADDFADYAQEFVSDIYGIDNKHGIYPYIDWDSFVDDLEMDYSTVEFDGERYYYRE